MEEIIMNQILKTHAITWGMITPDDNGYASVTIKNGMVFTSSIQTGLAKILTAEEYVNHILGSKAVTSINSFCYSDSWLGGRKYIKPENILKASDDSFEINPTILKYITLIKAVASESVKEENKQIVYQIDSNLEENVIEYNYFNDNDLEKIQAYTKTLEEYKVEDWVEDSDLTLLFLELILFDNQSKQKGE